MPGTGTTVDIYLVLGTTTINSTSVSILNRIPLERYCTYCEEEAVRTTQIPVLVHTEYEERRHGWMGLGPGRITNETMLFYKYPIDGQVLARQGLFAHHVGSVFVI